MLQLSLIPILGETDPDMDQSAAPDDDRLEQADWSPPQVDYRQGSLRIANITEEPPF